MTITANDRRYEYAGNGTTTVFTGPRAFSASNVTVYLVTDGVSELTEAYTLTGVGARNTVVTMDVAPATGVTLLILRTVAYSQGTDISNQGAYLPEVLENGLDALVQQIQQLGDRNDLSVRFSDTENTIDPLLPAPEALKYLRINAAGDAFEYTANAVPADSISDDMVNTDAAIRAGKLSFTQFLGAGVARSVSAKLADTIGVRDFGAFGSGDDTAAVQEAVSAAYNNSGELLWPADDYAVTDSVPNLWDVPHSGPGRLVRGAATLPMTRKEADSITLYVDPAGDDGNDGLTADYPLATIQNALGIFNRYGQRGKWTIVLAAGTYVENPGLSTLATMEYPLTVQGPAAGHPNVPTAVIQASDTGDYIFSASDEGWLILKDLRLTGATTSGGVSAQRCRVSLTNVHIDGCLHGVLSQHGALVSATGGLWTGLGSATAGGYGYRSFYNSTHSLVAASTSAALVISDYATGLMSTEGCQGHLDLTVIQDCDVGLHITRGAGANNTDRMTIKRCAVGINARDHWFNNNIDFGIGADENTVNVRSAGGAPEYDWRCGDYQSKTLRVQEATFVGSHTGTTAATTLWTSPELRDWMVSEAGDVSEVNLSIQSAAGLSTACTLRLFISDGVNPADQLTSVSIPAGTTAAQVRCIVQNTGASAQRASTSVISNSGTAVNTGDGSVALKNTAFTFFIDASLGVAGDAFSIRTLDFRTTLGG